MQIQKGLDQAYFKLLRITRQIKLFLINTDVPIRIDVSREKLR